MMMKKKRMRKKEKKTDSPHNRQTLKSKSKRFALSILMDVRHDLSAHSLSLRLSLKKKRIS